MIILFTKSPCVLSMSLSPVKLNNIHNLIDKYYDIYLTTPDCNLIDEKITFDKICPGYSIVNKNICYIYYTSSFLNMHSVGPYKSFYINIRSIILLYQTIIERFNLNYAVQNDIKLGKIYNNITTSKPLSHKTNLKLYTHTIGNTNYTFKHNINTFADIIFKNK